MNLTKVLLIFIYLTISLSAECNSNLIDNPIYPDHKYAVSIFSLLAVPDQFDNKIITVKGVFNFNQLESVIYPSEEFWQNEISDNAVRIVLPANATRIAEIKSLSGHFVTVSGRFKAHEAGHLGFVPSSIDNVYFLSGVLPSERSTQRSD